jgi:PTS system nitrogen regulatory IIA component
MQLEFRDILRVFKVSEKTVQNWIDKKKMPCVTANEQYRFNYINLLEWALENNIKLNAEILNLSEAEFEGHVLSNALKRGDVHYDIAGNSREEVLKAVVDILPLPREMDRDHLFEMLWARESMSSTAVGNGIAIPHVRNPIVLHIDQPVVTVCFLKSPIDFKALDRKPVFILFIVLSPSVKMHLAVLARLAFCLQDPKLQDYLHRRASREEVLADFFVLEAKLELYKNGNGKGQKKT